MCSQLLFVPPRGKRGRRTIYLRFGDDGQLVEAYTNMSVQPDVPCIRIHYKEYLRLVRLHDIPQATLSPDERKEHRRESYRRYRQRIVKQRIQMGKPLIPIPPGRRAPDDAVAQALALIGQINPATKKPYTGIEIAMRTQLSASSISRIRHGQRRKES